jgi:EmrB/QacA subfamily drug resistance transporter
MSVSSLVAEEEFTNGATPRSKAQINVIFATILLAVLLSALDQTIVSTALPTIVGELGGAGHMSWVVTSYMLAETIAAVLAGKFGDLFGRKRIFQISVVVFIAGSLLCGLAQNMTMLVLSRGIQGIGGGGLMVTATALIAEVVPLRDRGKYQGALGAVFAVTTVLGPLLGGLFTDHLSWRWAFYVNVPIAIVVMVLAARTIPGRSGTAKPRIDYLGVVFVALGSSGLILATSWGGTEYEWGSPTIITLFAASVVALVIFVLIERRAPEPILPLRLFRRRVFSIASILSFIVGFAMMGSITFMPTFLQFVNGATATASGMRMLPMVAGLLVAGIASGVIVGRTGKYRIFPIAGGVVITLGLFLLSLMDESTSVLVQSLSFLVLGIGIGLVMQILTLIVQNTVSYQDLGTSTSAVTFFRTLGASFGAAVLGSVFANNLEDKLPEALAQTPTVDPSSASKPDVVWSLSGAERAPIVDAYAESLHNVFLWAIPVGVLALAVALLLPQVTLHGRERAAAAGEGFAVPESGDVDTQLENIIAEVLRRTDRSAWPEILAASGSSLDRAGSWGVSRVFLRSSILGVARQSSIEKTVGLPPGVLQSFYDELCEDGWLQRDGDVLRLTAAGQSQVLIITTAWRQWVIDELQARNPAEGSPVATSREISAALDRLVVRLVRESESEPAAN